MDSRRKPSACLVRPELDFSSCLRGNIYQRESREMLPNWTLQQVKKSRKLIITFFFMVLLICPVNTKPMTKVVESGNKITVQTTGCKPVSTDELRSMYGEAFDENLMGYDEVSSKRSPDESVIDDDDDDIEDFVDEDEDDIDGALEDDDDDESGTISVQSRKFMRRKRDAMLTNSDNTNSVSSDIKFLYHNLLYDSISKRKSRQRRSSKVSSQRTEWTCEEKLTTRTFKNYFPSKVFTTKCKSDSCFFSFYACTPEKYAIKLLKRDPKDACKPVPLIGRNTTYEESWKIKRLHVTVACKCGPAWSESKLKRTRNRSRTRKH